MEEKKQSNEAHDDVEHARWLWFVRTFEANRSARGEQLLSAQALLNEIDLQIAFRAGAWVSTIVLAFAAIEAKVRQLEHDDFQSNVCQLLEADPDLVWLREIRNEIMHSGKPGSASKVWLVEGHDLAATHAALEAPARRAVEIMFRTIYGKDAAVRPS